MALFSFLQAGFWGHLFNPKTPPVGIYIDFSMLNYIGEKEIEIDEDKDYTIGLGFVIKDSKKDKYKNFYKMDLFFNGVDRFNLTADGAYSIGEGTDIPFKIIIKDIKTQGRFFYYEHTYITTKKMASGNFDRIAGTVHLKPGKYIVQVVVTKAFSELKDEKGYIVINNIRKRK